MDGLFPAYSDAMNDGDDDRIPANHPMRLRLPASHRFLPGDLFSNTNPLRILYSSEAFIAFIKDILGVSAIYPVADTPQPGHVISDSSNMAMFGRVNPL